MNPPSTKPTTSIFQVPQAPQEPVSSLFAANSGTATWGSAFGPSSFSFSKQNTVQGATINGASDRTKTPTPAPSSKPASFQTPAAAPPAKGEGRGPVKSIWEQPAAPLSTGLTVPGCPAGPPLLAPDFKAKRDYILRKCHGRVLCGGAFGDLTIFINRRRSVAGTLYEPTPLVIPRGILLAASSKFQGRWCPTVFSEG